MHKTEAQNLVAGFPAMFEQAVTDLAKYQAAKKHGTVPYETQREIEGWFYEFPRVWGAIQPNWQWADDGKPAAADKLRFAERVNRWVIRLRGESYQPSELGIAPLIIAGVLIAAAFGAAGLTWAIGHMQKQSNISKIIDGVARGILPAEALEEAVKVEKGGLFSGVASDAIKITVALGVLFFLLPRLFKSGPPPGARTRAYFGD